MVVSMFMNIQNSKLFLTAVTPTAVAPVASDKKTNKYLYILFFIIPQTVCLGLIHITDIGPTYFQITEQTNFNAVRLILRLSLAKALMVLFVNCTCIESIFICKVLFNFSLSVADSS